MMIHILIYLHTERSFSQVRAAKWPESSEEGGYVKVLNFSILA